MAEYEHPNQEAVAKFMAQFTTVKRPIAGTQNIGDSPVNHGYTASYFDEGRKIGFTVVCFNYPDGFSPSIIKSWVEFVGSPDSAEQQGKAIAGVIEGLAA